MRPIPQLAVDFLKRAEGLRLAAYLDGGGVPTIGYGHTGPDVRPGARISYAQASALLESDIREAAGRLAARLNRAAVQGLSDHQYAALISFVFNLGASPKWTIWRLVNAGDLEGVPAQILRFNKVRRSNGRVETLPGLTQRRAAEVALWLAPDARAAGVIAAASPSPPSSETRRAETPPTPSTSGLARSGSFGAAVAAAVAATPVAIDQAKSGALAVSQLVSPYADRSQLLQHLLGGLAVICAVLAVTSAVLQYLRHRRDRTR